MSRSVLVVPAGFERTTIITPLVDNTSMIAYINPGTVVRGRVRCGDEDMCDFTLTATEKLVIASLEYAEGYESRQPIDRFCVANDSMASMLSMVEKIMDAIRGTVKGDTRSIHVDTYTRAEMVIWETFPDVMYPVIDDIDSSGSDRGKLISVSREWNMIMSRCVVDIFNGADCGDMPMFTDDEDHVIYGRVMPNVRNNARFTLKMELVGDNEYTCVLALRFDKAIGKIFTMDSSFTAFDLARMIHSKLELGSVTDDCSIEIDDVDGHEYKPCR